MIPLADKPYYMAADDIALYDADALRNERQVDMPLAIRQLRDPSI